MPRYRFLAADSAGVVSDGTIDAATQTDARNKLAANGLAVRELEEAAATAGMAAPELPRRTVPKSSSSSGVEPIPGTRRSARADPAVAPRRGSRTALLLATIALAISVLAAAYVVYRDPPWGRLSRYDFSTPEAAYTSQLRINANADLPALIELQRKLQGKQVREKLDTVHVARSREFRGKQILFIYYEQKGMRMYEIAFMERDVEAGKMWKQSYVSHEEIRNADPSLAAEIANWRSTGAGNFGPPPGMPAAGERDPD